MVTVIEPGDLDGKMPAGWTAQQIQDEIDAAMSWVRIYAPCLESMDAVTLAAVKAVLRKAVPYNAAASVTPSSSVVNRVNAGPLGFSTETQAPRDPGGYFSPTQIQALSGLCSSRGARFGTIRTRPL